jgi:hypothetical protein
LNENSETYGQEFYYAVMQPIASLVKAYGEGRLDLDPPSKDTPGTNLREAAPERLYTAITVAKKLGWTHKEAKTKAGIQADVRVRVALNALDLIEKGALKRTDIIGLNQSQVATTVKAVKARVNAELADIDSTISVKETAFEKAQSEGDTNKANKLEKEIESIADAQEAKALKAGKAAAREIKEIFNPPSPGDIFDAAAPPEPVPTQAVKTATQKVYDRIAKLEKLCLDTDPLNAVVSQASPKAQDAYRDTLARLSERAKNRARGV